MTQTNPHRSAEDFLAPVGAGWDWHVLLVALLRGKRLALLMGIGCAVLAWLILHRVPTVYQATVELLPPQISRSSNGASMLSQAGTLNEGALFSSLSSSLQTKSQADIFVLILNAWPVQNKLVERFGLVAAYGKRTGSAARELLAARTSTKAMREGVIVLAYVDTNRQRAADIANAYVDESRKFLNSMAVSEASQRRDFYERQLATTKKDLEEAEVAFKQMQQKNGMITIDAQARTLIDGAAGLRSQITAKEVELQSMRGYLTEGNAQLQITETELNALRSQLVQLESRGQGGYSGKALSSVPASALEFVRTTRELKYQEGLYDLMVKQFEGSRIDEAREAPVVQVIEPALVPERKFGPHRLRDICAAFVFGVMLGFFLTLVRHLWEKSELKGSTRLKDLRQAAFRWS